MKHLPKISIIIPSYNQGNYIGFTLDSILSQNYPNLEVLVMDGGSKDNTVDVLKTYGKKINWVSQKDNGQTDAINKGVHKTTGDIVGYVNSDDMLEPNALWRVVTALEKNPQKQWVTGDYRIVDSENAPRDSFIVLYKRVLRNIMQVVPFAFPLILGITNPLIQPSTFWRRHTHEVLGDMTVELRYTMDYDWWWRLYRQFGAPVWINAPVSAFRVHALAKGGHSFSPQVDEQYAVAQKHGVLAPILLLQKLHSWVYTRIYYARSL